MSPEEYAARLYGILESLNKRHNMGVTFFLKGDIIRVFIQQGHTYCGQIKFTGRLTDMPQVYDMNGEQDSGIAGLLGKFLLLR